VRTVLIAILFLINLVSAFMTVTLIYDNKLDVAVTVMVLTLTLDAVSDNDEALTLILVFIVAFIFFTVVYLIEVFRGLVSTLL